MAIIKNELAGSINGVAGRFFNVVTWHETEKVERVRGLIANQKWISESRPVKGYGTNGSMTVEIRHDDGCKNGHEDFAITATIVTAESKRQRDIAAGGCMHDEIESIFPELAPLIKWHLCSIDQPMHYIANATYHASDRDHNGLAKGELRQLRSGKTGIPAWHLVAVDSMGAEIEIHELEKYANGETQPAEKWSLEYRPWCTVGEGKERDFNAARAVAIWPEATDEQLSLPKEELATLLEARLPALLSEFRAAVEACGFIFSGRDHVAVEMQP